MTPLLEIRDLRVHYGLCRAVRGVHLELPERGILCIVGPNGAGKSSLLRAICGEGPYKGEVRLNGKVLHGGTFMRARAGIIQVPEGRCLVPNLTVQENLRLSLFARERGAQQNFDREVRTLAERFPVIVDRAQQRAGTLSGGEQQAVAIGRALLARPKILLLDEPSLGLAPILVQRTIQILREVRDSGVTMLIVEQNALVASSLSSSLLLMREGQLSPIENISDPRKVWQAYLEGNPVSSGEDRTRE